MKRLLIVLCVVLTGVAWVRFGPFGKRARPAASRSTFAAVSQGGSGKAVSPIDAASIGCSYEIRDDAVFLPGWDDRPPSAPLELLRIPPADFESPARVDRDRVVMQSGTVRTIEFTIPIGTTELVFLGRGAPVEDLFPRVSISALITGTAGSAAQELFNGYVLSRSQTRLTCPVPGWLAGKKARIEITHLNPSGNSTPRPLWIAYIAFR
jgi:hypothetical protein